MIKNSIAELKLMTKENVIPDIAIILICFLYVVGFLLKIAKKLEYVNPFAKAHFFASISILRVKGSLNDFIDFAVNLMAIQ